MKLTIFQRKSQNIIDIYKNPTIFLVSSYLLCYNDTIKVDYFTQVPQNDPSCGIRKKGDAYECDHEYCL